MAKLKGHAVIELTDVKTGKKERFEHDNIVTNAVPEFFNFWKNLYGWGAMRRHFLPLCEKMFSGIYLFDDELTESADNKFIPNVATAKLTGYAGHYTSDGQDAQRGSFNFLESGAITNGYKLVWDFGTAEANGDIASVALTHGISGYHGYYYDAYRIFYNPSTQSGNDPNNNNYKGLWWTGSDSYSSSRDYVSFFIENEVPDEISKKALVGFKIENNAIRQKYFRDKVSDETPANKLLNTEVITNNIKITDYAGSQLTGYIDGAVGGYAGLYNQAVETESDILVAACFGNSLFVEHFNKDTGVYINGGEIPVYSQIGKKGYTGIFTSSGSRYAPILYRKGGDVFFICYEDSYASNEWNVAKYKVSTGAVTLITPKITGSIGQMYVDVNGNVHIGRLIIDANDNYINTGIVMPSYEDFGIVDSYAIDFCGKIIPNLQYLATVNNLDVPVTKTAAKTMKITYTLTLAT